MASSSGRNDGPETLIPKALQRLAAIGLPVREHVSGRMGRMHAPPAEFGVPRSSNTAKHRPIQVALNAWNDTFGSEAASLKMAEIQAEKKRLKKARKDVDDATELLVRTAAEVAAANDRGKTTQDTPVHPAETPTAAPAAEAAPAEGAEHRRKQRAPQPAPLSGSAPEGAPVGDYELYAELKRRIEADATGLVDTDNLLRHVKKRKSYVLKGRCPICKELTSRGKRYTDAMWLYRHITIKCTKKADILKA